MGDRERTTSSGVVSETESTAKREDGDLLGPENPSDGQPSQENPGDNDGIPLPEPQVQPPIQMQATNGGDYPPPEVNATAVGPYNQMQWMPHPQQPLPPHLCQPPPPPPPSQQHILQFYEAQMRDHAVAYASAAAGAAWAAAQIAADMNYAAFSNHPMATSSGSPYIPRALPVPLNPYSAGGGGSFLPSFVLNPPPHSNNNNNNNSPDAGSMHPSSPLGYPPAPFAPYNPPPSVMDFQHYMEGPNTPTSASMGFTGDHDGNAFPSNYPTHPNHSHHGHRRRKRQQRMPPSHATTSQGADMGQDLHNNRNPHHPLSSNTRRRYPQDQLQDSVMQQQQPPHPGNNNNRRHTRIRKAIASSNSSDGGSSGAAGYFSRKKKARQPNDGGLLGKTGVSALYEWCGKRRTIPTFTLTEPDVYMDPTTVAATTTQSSLLQPSQPSSPLSSPVSQPQQHDVNREEPTKTTLHRTSSIEEEERRRRLGCMGKEFEIAVSIDGMELGRGRGRTKAAAKQEAARRALQALLPGVIFEPASGILVQLPNTRGNGHASAATTNPQTVVQQQQALWKATASLEDLAPNLAKRLAIGHGDDDDDDDDEEEDVSPTKGGQSKTLSYSSKSNEFSKKRPPKYHSVYTGTSTTTSDDEDADAYYASRGASVCSALLHAMVQIDERIPEAPSYAYEVATVSPLGEVQVRDGTAVQLKRKAGGSPLFDTSVATGLPIQVHRGPFTCTASMRLLRADHNKGDPDAFETLQAVGVGGNKREARHTACAKLLALLFPECEGMMQVKEAAEAARERYAASKALKQQSKRERAFMSRNQNWNQSIDSSSSLSMAMASPSSTCPPLPQSTEQHFLAALGINTEPKDENDESSTARQYSRQEQFDNRIAAALQKLNEHDEEGRSLPEELTVDDVGRTILRRADPEDFHWVTKLLSGAQPPLHSVSGDNFTRHDDSEPTVVSSSVPVNLRASSTIVLLLCRAIAPYEDPPLGCAVLTMGFSMNKGKVLCMSQMGSEPHLPRERFIECLQSFADCMQCTFETKNDSASAAGSVLWRQSEIQSILQSHLPSTEGIQLQKPVKPAKVPPEASQFPGEEPTRAVSSPLQSVQEECEGAEDSGAESNPEKRVNTKSRDKPSKRSRVQ